MTNKQEPLPHLSITIPKWANIYTLASVFPTLSVFSCWGVYYSMKHNTPGVLRTISETVNPFPENRIFPVTMNMECIFLTIAYWIRNSLTSESSKESHKSVSVRLFFMKALLPFIIIGLSLLADVTLIDNTPLHLTGATVFFMFSIIYLILADSTAKTLGWNVPLFSRIAAWCIPFVFVGHNVVFGLGRTSNDMKMYSIGSLLQYLMCILIFFKVFMMQFEIPKHTLSNYQIKAKKE